MEAKTKEALKVSILERIVAAKEDIAAFEELSKPVAPDNAIGRLTRMEAINSKSINEAALYKAQEKLLKLERALENIEDPDFGLCRECEEPIPSARLMIMPETDLCVECAEDLNG